MNSFDAMSYAARLTVRSATVTPSAGTESLTGCSVTLRDSRGDIAGGVDGVDAPFDADPGTAPRASYDFDPIALGLPEPTGATGQHTYSLEFTMTDANGRRPVSTHSLVVKPRGS